MNFKNKIVTIHGKKYFIKAGKPTTIPNRSVYLLSALGDEVDYSLWLVEIEDDGQNASFWLYEGTDADKLIKELLEEFIETAFE